MIRLRFGKTRHNYTHPRYPRYVSLDSSSRKPDFHGTLKVITYNIRLARETEKAIDLLTNHNDLHDADILCLQEMDHRGVDLIARSLNYNYVYYPAIHHPRSARDFGNAILSKWPIISDRKIILPKSGAGKLQRIAVNATISVNGTKISVFSIHMKIYTRRRQRRALIDHILSTIEPSVKNCIVAGDFNTFSKSIRRTFLEPLKEAAFQSATESIGWTYKYWYLLNKRATLDHIFIKGMSVISSGKVVNRKPSDHIPVWGEMQLAG
jgi:endonuclease/exonuclease/phosphatase family metal-dependent hydrolase